MWWQVRLGQNRYDSKSLKIQNLFDARLDKVGIGRLVYGYVKFRSVKLQKPYEKYNFCK